MRFVTCVALCTACGRAAFDALPPADGKGVDGEADAPAGFDTACDDLLAGAIFCDGFEDGPAFAPWLGGIRMAANGTLSWSSQAYRGNGALRIDITGVGDNAYVQTPTSSAGSAVTGGAYWERLYVRFPASADLTHFDFASIANETSGNGMELYVDTSRPHVWFGEPSSFYQSVTSFPRDRWTCLEAHLEVADTGGSFEIFVDGGLVIAMSNIDTLPVGYNRLAVGITSSQFTQAAATIEIDEVAVGTARLPCD